MYSHTSVFGGQEKLPKIILFKCWDRKKTWTLVLKTCGKLTTQEVLLKVISTHCQFWRLPTSHPVGSKETHDMRLQFHTDSLFWSPSSQKLSWCGLLPYFRAQWKKPTKSSNCCLSSSNDEVVCTAIKYWQGIQAAQKSLKKNNKSKQQTLSPYFYFCLLQIQCFWLTTFSFRNTTIAKVKKTHNWALYLMYASITHVSTRFY